VVPDIGITSNQKEGRVRSLKGYTGGNGAVVSTENRHQHAQSLDLWRGRAASQCPMASGKKVIAQFECEAKEEIDQVNLRSPAGRVRL
jgi:hypothetical protein